MNIYVNIYIYKYISIDIYIYVYVYIYMCVQIYKHLCIYIYMCMYARKPCVSPSAETAKNSGFLLIS